MEERVCPVCDVELETDEVCDGYIGLSTREEHWHGHCPRCKVKYRWVEVYEYKETRYFEVDIEEEN